MNPNGLSLIQDPLTFVGKLGQSFAESGMFGCKTAAQGHVLALHCVMEQVSPLTIMQAFHFIEGKLSMRADAMMGRAIAAGCEMKVLSRTSELATVYLADKDGDGQEFSLSWADCQKEPFVRDKTGGIKTNYATPRIRTQMLWARVVSDAVRTMRPDLVCGVYTPEELEDEPAPLPAGVVEGELATAPATAATTQSVEPAKRRKAAAKDPVTEQPTTAAPSQAAPVTTTADPVVETQAAPVASGSSAPQQSIAEVVQQHADPAASTPAAAATTAKLPQQVTDIIQLRDYVGARWPADHKQGDWAALWVKVKASLRIVDGVSDEEGFTKAPDAIRDKTISWLNTQRQIVDKLSGSRDLNTWANQNPTTSATKSA